MLDALNATAFTLFGAPTTWAEVIGFVSGVVMVWLIILQNPWNWPVSILNNLMFFVLFLASGIYAVAWLQVLFIVLAIYGWWAWLRGGEARGTLAISRTTPAQWWTLAAATVAATAVLAWILDAQTDSTVPLPDALTTVLSIVATWSQARKKIESWWLWIAADAIYVPLYIYKDLWLTAILFAGFLGMCVLGLRAWMVDYKSPAPAPAPA